VSFLCCLQRTKSDSLLPLSNLTGIPIEISSCIVRPIPTFQSRDDVAKVIEFYIPNNFRKTGKWVSLEHRGKIIEFAPQNKKSA
jgi:hypothetical protein